MSAYVTEWEKTPRIKTLSLKNRSTHIQRKENTIRLGKLRWEPVERREISSSVALSVWEKAPYVLPHLHTCRVTFLKYASFFIHNNSPSLPHLPSHLSFSLYLSFSPKRDAEVLKLGTDQLRIEWTSSLYTTSQKERRTKCQWMVWWTGNPLSQRRAKKEKRKLKKRTVIRSLASSSPQQQVVTTVVVLKVRRVMEPRRIRLPCVLSSVWKTLVPRRFTGHRYSVRKERERTSLPPGHRVLQEKT